MALGQKRNPSGDGGFEFPEFWEYPPYFTVQPVPETFEKQKDLWCGLILRYCKHTRTFIVDVHDEDFVLFRNKKIDRTYHALRCVYVCVCDCSTSMMQGISIEERSGYF